MAGVITRADAPTKPPRTRGSVWTAVGAALTVILVACGSPPQRWITDDLLEEDGVYFVTCEDSADERREKQVNISYDEATKFAPGQDCPNGEIRRGPYYEAEDHDSRVKSVPPPKASTRPTGTQPPRTSSGSSPRPGATAPPKTGSTSTSGRPAPSAGTPVNQPPPPSTTKKKTSTVPTPTTRKTRN